MIAGATLFGLLSLVLATGCGDKDDTGTDGTTDGGATTDGGTEDGGSGDGGMTDGGADGGATGDAVVVVTGGVYLGVGDVLTLSATTVNGDDGSYTWTSSDEDVATVDSSGVVTGVFSGEVWITAEGDSSGVSGQIGLYVEDEIPNYEDWVNGAHADYTAEAFNHWNEDGEVSSSCAKCHTSTGFMDYIGADGSEAFSTDSAHAIGQVIDCEACHNDTANSLDTVIFPSEVEVTGLGGEARCMTCHQGRESGADVDAAIADLKLTDLPDESSGDLGFENVHYYPAAATLYAGEAMGGYQYDGKVYDYRFRHVSSKDTCIECHDAHSLELKIDECSVCHEGVTSTEDLKDIRMMASASSDYDGDGNLDEGIYYEVDGMRETLLSAIEQYADDQGFTGICYAEHDYPYWFHDTDGSGGPCGDDEADYSNAYAEFSPRLLKATYNYQLASKDPGNFAHNAKYTLELLYDSIEDLNDGLTTPVDMSAMTREDPGHFNGAGEPARHWDEDESISSSCTQCHGGADGLHFYLEYGVGLADEAPDNGLECETCHTEFETYGLITVDSVTFPSGIEIEDEGNPDYICMTCHQGRESGADVDAAIADDDLEFVNVHYLPAGAMKKGSEVEVGYQYGGKSYSGEWTGHLGGDGCTDCHSPEDSDHTFMIEDVFDGCTGCHSTAGTVEDVRVSHDQDYDGDGNTDEALADELAGLSEALLAAIMSEAGDAPICYEEHSYPYWFNDTDADGDCSDGDASYSNSYDSWTPALLKATFNYQFIHKEPGAWAHNFDYASQLLIDSLQSLGADVSGYVRPDAD